MTKPKIIILAIAALIIVATLFIPPFFGKGDDGSLYSTLLQNGLYNTEGADTSFFTGIYGVSPSSSESGFFPITIAKALCGFVSTTILDVRVLAALYLPVYFAAMYLIIRSIRIKHPIAEIAACALAAVILCDIGYISYMNSLYSDTLYLVFFMLFAGSLLNIKKDEGLSLPCFVLMIISSAVLATRGIDGMILGIVAGAAIIILKIVSKNFSVSAFVCGALAIVTSVVCCIASPAAQPQPSQLYSRVFDGALTNSASPASDLNALGISDEYAGFAGKSYYTAYEESNIISSPAFAENFAEKATESKIFMFYIKNPGRFTDVLSSAGKNAPFLTQSYIKTKMNTDYSIKAAPGVWSYGRRFLTPASFPIILALALLVLAVSVIISKKDLSLALGGIAASVASLVFFVSPILKSGLMNISRNLILHQAAMDLMIILIVCFAINLALAKRQELKDKYGVNQ